MVFRSGLFRSLSKRGTGKVQRVSAGNHRGRYAADPSALDFMGQNIYNGYYVRQGADGEPEFVDREPGFPKTACNWPVTPKAFYYGIKFLTERYPLPLYITENGMSCHDNVSFDGRVHDNDRITFLDSYIGAMQRAYDEGADIRGVFPVDISG